MKYRKLETHFSNEQKKIPTTNITENIKRNLKEIITIYYKKHENKKKKSTILSFQENFSPKNGLCTIENNHLTFNLNLDCKYVYLLLCKYMFYNNMY